MGRIRKEWLYIYNGLMSGALVLLGFAGCDENNANTVKSENGIPYAKYEIKGKVLDVNGRTVTNARIIVNHLVPQSGGLYEYATSDTVYTKENGEYLYQNKIAGDRNFRIICEDLSDNNNVDSLDITMEPTGGKGSYEGTDRKEINFRLRKGQVNESMTAFSIR